MTTASPGLDSAAWQRVRTELVRFVRSRVVDATAADDIVHDVLVRTLAALEGPEPPAHLRGWLYRLTRNAIVDHHRGRRPAGELPADLAAPAETAAGAEQALARCLEPLVATLPAHYRRALTLADVDGLAQREIAEREAISLSGAKSRVQRARALLREAVLACCRVEVDARGGVFDFTKRPGGACAGHCD